MHFAKQAWVFTRPRASPFVLAQPRQYLIDIMEGLSFSHFIVVMVEKLAKLLWQYPLSFDTLSFFLSNYFFSLSPQKWSKCKNNGKSSLKSGRGVMHLSSVHFTLWSDKLERFGRHFPQTSPNISTYLVPTQVKHRSIFKD